MLNKEDFAGFATHEYRPIIRSESMKVLQQLVVERKPKNILEIGTFIGYSASVMLDANKDAFVVTLEKDKQNSVDAVKNLTEQGFAGRFEVINCDAYDFLQSENDRQFDLIFLDGPKGQYYKYLPYLKKMLKSGGVLVADDVLFYGLVMSKEKIEHKHRSLVNNLRKFLSMLESDEDFETTIHQFDNGVSVSIKK
ncbi:MAG: O-methyltransferase, partial [Clostridia bacterium]|nr:O-methyltransferase [Clostridia bacterium]